VGLLRTEQYGVATELLNERKAKVKTTRLLYAEKAPRNVVLRSLVGTNEKRKWKLQGCYTQKAPA